MKIFDRMNPPSLNRPESYGGTGKMDRINPQMAEVAAPLACSSALPIPHPANPVNPVKKMLFVSFVV